MDLMYVVPSVALGVAAFASVVLASIRKWPGHPLNRSLLVASTLVCLYGLVAFFAQALGAMGALPFIGPDVEWPVGRQSSVAQTSGGDFVVSLIPCGRVQMYDASGRFERGWFVDASGGDFKLDASTPGKIIVFTARAMRRLVYSSDGHLLQKSSYSQSFNDIAVNTGVERLFVYPWPLWPLSHPFAAWGTMVLGMIGVALFGVRERRRTTG